MRPERAPDWARLRDLALGLGLPGVEETTTWGEPALKAHGKLWTWWSPNADAPVFKVPLDRRDMLLEADPETFLLPDHYRRAAMILVRPERLDPDWARAVLIETWRAQAPKRLLKAFDAGRS